MNKTTFSMILFVSICLTVGCGNKKLELDKIQNSTMMLTKDGGVTAAIIEEFEKPYYTEDGLTTFIKQEVGAYNKINGENIVTIDTVRVKDGTASLLMNFKSIEHYANLNHVEIKVLTMEEAIQNTDIPVEFTDISTNEITTWEEMKENTKYKVVLVTEPIDIIVNGKIKYYSGGVLLNDNSVQTKGSELCAIVYKP